MTMTAFTSVGTVIVIVTSHRLYILTQFTHVLVLVPFLLVHDRSQQQCDIIDVDISITTIIGIQQCLTSELGSSHAVTKKECDVKNSEASISVNVARDTIRQCGEAYLFAVGGAGAVGGVGAHIVGGVGGEAGHAAGEAARARTVGGMVAINGRVLRGAPADAACRNGGAAIGSDVAAACGGGLADVADDCGGYGR